MKIRMLLSTLTALLAVTSFCLLSASAHAQDDFERCGTPYPGWWRHILGPKSLTDMVQVSDFAINQVIGATDTYDVSMTLVNRGNRTIKRMPVALSFAMGDGSVFPNPDDPFNPNNPGNPYAVIQSQMVTRQLIGLLRPGDKFQLAGRISGFQGRGAKMLSISMGYDDWDWCGTKPHPWPGPNPWWDKVVVGGTWDRGLIIDMAPTTDPQAGPFPGYETVGVVVSLTNNTRLDIPQGKTYQFMQRVVGGDGMPNPDDPFNPNSPWGPYADNFRYNVGRGYLPAVQSGATIYLRLKVTYPTQVGYANLLSLQIR